MQNMITEKYFIQGSLLGREKEILKTISEKTGFTVGEEIFRGQIYDEDKVRSLIYRGVFQGNPSVLKIQGLKPEVEETTIINAFNGQNKSSSVRLPVMYVHEPYEEKRGYGYMISEYIDAPKIFEMPFATPEEMQKFANFYQEYRAKAITKPWLESETTDSLAYFAYRIDHWRKICEHKGRLQLEEYAPYLMRYYPLAVKHLPSLPMTFCHGHLTANDIRCAGDGNCIVTANILWGYRPQWYDLAFNVWACLLHIRDTNYSFEEMLHYINQWLDVYKNIPIVQQDSDFERKIHILLLERTMGSILADLGANDFFGKEENKELLAHLLRLHQQLFDFLVLKLEEK